MTVKISEILKKTPGKFCLLFSDGSSIQLDKKTLIDFNIHEGQDFSAEEFEKLKLQIDYINAEKIMLNKLKARKRSERELTDILTAAKIDELVIQNLIDKFKKLNFINDYSFAESFVNDRLKLNRKPLKIIRIELRRFGISEQIINEILDARKICDPDAELNNCIALARKKKQKYKNLLENHEEKNKMIQYLALKGYDFEIINHALEELKIEKED